jgi:hypothetical protein
MRPKLFLLILACSFFSGFAFAAESDAPNDVSVEEQMTRYHIFVGLETVSFQLGTGGLTGNGIYAGFETYMNKKFGLDISLNQVYGQQNQGSSGGSPFQVIATAIQLGVSYPLIGDFNESVQSISVDGKRVIKDTENRSSTLRIGVGTDEYWFSGSSSVYPASGLDVFLNGTYKIYGHWFRPGIRYSSLSSNSGLPITALMINLGFDL